MRPLHNDELLKKYEKIILIFGDLFLERRQVAAGQVAVPVAGRAVGGAD